MSASLKLMEESVLIVFTSSISVQEVESITSSLPSRTHLMLPQSPGSLHVLPSKSTFRSIEMAFSTVAKPDRPRLSVMPTAPSSNPSVTET